MTPIERIRAKLAAIKEADEVVANSNPENWDDVTHFWFSSRDGKSFRRKLSMSIKSTPALVQAVEELIVAAYALSTTTPARLSCRKEFLEQKLRECADLLDANATTE